MTTSKRKPSWRTSSRTFTTYFDYFPPRAPETAAANSPEQDPPLQRAGVATLTTLGSTCSDWPPRWIDDDGGATWPVNGYANEGERRTDWFVTGVVKYHRTLATTLNTLIAEGFAIRALAEFAPTAEQVARDPTLAPERERPMLLLVSAEAVG